MKRSIILSILIIGLLSGCSEGQRGTERQPVPAFTPEAKVLSETIVPTTSVNLYFIALEDNGKNGDLIGCGDSIVSVTKTINPTNAPLTAALNELLKIKDQNYGESGLYNTLYEADLELSDIEFKEGKVTVKLTGQMNLRGVCDNPRVEAQLKKTILQFPSVKEVEIYINDKKLEELLSGQG